MDDPPERGHRSDQADENLHIAASLAGSPKANPAGAAADEYVKRHRRRFTERIERAQQALLNSKAATLAYVLGISEQDVDRLGGVTDGRDAASCDAKRDIKRCGGARESL